ncbi:MAG: hypothetical protein CFK49_09625 [Armatimonadetes bacterium JP3_11]|jgi:hypothetical protein|nr:MAG: hypothetical protein CFK49_09625 [Armatimonadetes bacterium JP3_11]
MCDGIPAVARILGQQPKRFPASRIKALQRCFLATTLLSLCAWANAQVTLPPMPTPAGVVPQITIPNEALTPKTTPSSPRERPRTEKRNTLDALKALRDWESLQQEVQRTVTISGRKSVGFHLHQVEGDFTAFRDQNYFGQGGQRITDNTEMTIRVNKFLGFISFDWRWTNSRFRNPYDSRITYTYESPNFTLEWGDITASLGSSNPLVGFNRTLKGATAHAQWGNSRMRYIRSETKAAARTIQIQGNDSPGPYYLQGSQIVDGSERVQVDGVEKRRGEDYTIDYFGGILRFRDGTIIPRTSTIVVTYETYAFNSAPSLLEGWRYETNLGRGVNLGLTMLSQRSTARTPLRRRQEQFYGFGAPTVPYDLQFPPLRDANNPVIITVAGVPQVEGVDYYFDEVLPYRFYFTRFMPQTLIIQVEYTPRPDPSSTIGGDREVMGIDFTLPLGRVGNIVWNAARSTAQAQGSNLEAIAHTATGKFEFGRLSLSATYRNIPAEFIGIESVGFRRNERGYQTDLNYRLSPISNFQMNLTRLRVASLNPFSSTFAASFTDTDIQSYTYTHTPQNGFQFTLNRNTNTTRTGNGRNAQSRDSLSLARTWKNLNFSLGYEQSNSDAFSSLGGGARLNYRIRSWRTQLEWTVNTQLTLRSSAARSDIAQASGATNTHTRSLDYSVDVSWRPSANLSVNYRWRDSDSGALNLNDTRLRTRQHGKPLPPTTNFPTNPWGVGYDGNGFSSGAPMFSGYTYYGVRGKGQDLTVQWTPLNTLSVDVQWSQNRSLGDFQTNSAQESLTVGASFMPFEWLALSASWSKQQVQFLTATGNSSNEFLTVGADIGPLHRWTINLNFYLMKTRSAFGEGFQGGLGNFAQEPIGLSARITYDLGSKQNLFAEFQRTHLRGYLPSRDTLFNIGYEYRITRNWAFVLSYRFREQLNLDPQYSQYSYRARSLDASMNWMF